MIVYGSTLSPFVRKVMAFGAEKGIALELRRIGLGSDDPEFLAASPFGKMPALVDGDFRISDSTAIVFYLDATGAGPALIPEDARDRARVVWWDEIADTVLFGCFIKMFRNRIVLPKFQRQPGDAAEADRAEREEMPPLLDWLERQAPESGHLVGDRLTLADVAVASPLVNLMHLGIDMGRWPRVAAWRDAMLARESFREMVEGERRFLARVG